MNIFNLLTKEKHIAGVEISDSAVRILFFRPPKNKNLIKNIHLDKTLKEDNELVLIEEPLPENVISNGIVIDKELLAKTLKNVWSKANLTKSYAIVSIPEDKIYSNIFPFPKNINESHFEEAINLAIDFQLPFKRNDIYVSWEKINNTNNVNESLISAIPKNIADGYIKTLDNAGIKVLALESHIFSIMRSIKSDMGSTILFTKKNKDSATIFVLKDGVFQFSRTIPTTFIKDENSLLTEISKIKTSFESENKGTITELPLTKATIKEEYQKYLELNKNDAKLESKWLISIGAVFRGKIEEGKDNQISLLPVGRAEAYTYQKTTTFIELIRNLTIGVSAFFLLAFVAMYLFIFYLSQTTNKTNSITPTSISPDLLQKETWLKKVNEMTSVSKTILSTTPMWSILLDEINSRVVDGTIISNFSVTSINNPISINGTARDRNTLNQFKKSLQSSIYLTAVELPITNLEQKGDIPFAISFRIKDPSMLYYK